MANTSTNSTYGITATFDSTELGLVTGHSLSLAHVGLDDTDYSHARENNQAGIATVTGSIDCLGDPEIDEGDIGTLALGGTVTQDYGDCICTDVTLGGSVKGQRTTRYSFASSVEGS